MAESSSGWLSPWTETKCAKVVALRVRRRAEDSCPSSSLNAETNYTERDHRHDGWRFVERVWWHGWVSLQRKQGSLWWTNQWGTNQWPGHPEGLSNPQKQAVAFLKWKLSKHRNANRKNKNQKTKKPKVYPGPESRGTCIYRCLLHSRDFPICGLVGGKWRLVGNHIGGTLLLSRFYNLKAASSLSADSFTAEIHLLYGELTFHPLGWASWWPLFECQTHMLFKPTTPFLGERSIEILTGKSTDMRCMRRFHWSCLWSWKPEATKMSICEGVS